MFIGKHPTKEITEASSTLITVVLFSNQFELKSPSDSIHMLLFRVCRVKLLFESRTQKILVNVITIAHFFLNHKAIL
jgi:hypothetical protein